MTRIALLLAFLAGCGSPDPQAGPGTQPEDPATSNTHQADDADVGVSTAPDAADPDGEPDVSLVLPDVPVPDPDPDIGGGDQLPNDWVAAPTLMTDEPLCDIPPDFLANGGDPASPPCRFAGESLSDRDRWDVPETLRVVTWNVEFGKKSAAVLAALTTNPELRDAAVLLLVEVARHDFESVPADIDQAHDIATALAMNYVSGVEWDRRDANPDGGEHVITIMSKYPIGNVDLIRHTAMTDWYAAEARYGGRATLVADTLIGDTVLRIFAAHFDTRTTAIGRAQQGGEVIAYASLPGGPSMQLVGGDFNTFMCNPLIQNCTTAPGAEQVVEDFLAAGFQDGTVGFGGATQSGAGFLPQRLDWLFYRGLAVVPGHAVELDASDHFPLLTDIIP